MEVPLSYYSCDDHHFNFKATELRLGLPGTEEEPAEKLQSSNNVSGNINKRDSSKMSCDLNAEISEQNRVPPIKAQVVGWPPVRSNRRNCLQSKKTESDGSGVYVKVSMDGAPFLRKIDLTVYNNYPELLKALECMFKCNIGGYLEREGYVGSDYAPTYEDKDGDWMLAGDVPWDMFITSCKRLRIMKVSDAKGLG